MSLNQRGIAFLNFKYDYLSGRSVIQQNDIQLNETQQNDIEHNEIEHSDIQHNNK
jgi:hypothetical protein